MKNRIAQDVNTNTLRANSSNDGNENNRQQVESLAEQMQQATGENVELAYVDQGYTGEKATQAAEKYGIMLEVVKLP